MKRLHIKNIPTAKSSSTSLSHQRTINLGQCCRLRKRNIHNYTRAPFSHNNILDDYSNNLTRPGTNITWRNRHSYHHEWKPDIRFFSSGHDSNNIDANEKNISKVATEEDEYEAYTDEYDEKEDEVGGHDIQLWPLNVEKPDVISGIDKSRETSISKYLNLPENHIISVDEAREIKSCIRLLEYRVKKKKRSQDGVEMGFHDAANLEKLLHILLRNTIETAPQDSDVSLNNTDISVHDFNRALTAWRYASLGLQISPRPPDFASSTERYLHLLSTQRRNACRCLYACERSEKLLKTMEDLAMNGHSNLRPSQYSYESLLGSWARASGALNFMLRGEGRASAALRKIPPRAALTEGDKGILQAPWYHPTILDRYGLMDPAKKADEILSQLYTMEELDSTEFKISPWVLKQALIAWVQVKARPRRFSFEGELNSDKFQDELKIPVRAEKLLWDIVEISHANTSQGRGFFSTPSLFRAVISSWSHSNHLEGQ